MVKQSFQFPIFAVEIYLYGENEEAWPDRDLTYFE